MKTYDLAIIGGGPAGIQAAIRAHLNGGNQIKDIVLLDAGERLGGQLLRYLGEEIYDVPGHVQIRCKQFLDNLKQQLLYSLSYNAVTTLSNLDILTSTLVQKVSKNGKLFSVTVIREGRRLQILAKAIIIAGGIGPPSEPKKFGKPELDVWNSNGLYFEVENFQDFAGKTVLVVGGGDAAIKTSRQLMGNAKSVVMIHRRHEPSVECTQSSLFYSLKSQGILQTPWTLKAIQKANDLLMVTIQNTENKKEQQLLIDAVIACLGRKIDTDFFRDWGLEMNAGKIKVNSRTMMTNIPGIFAAGDIADAFDIKGQLLTLAAATADVAVLKAVEYLTGKQARVIHQHKKV